MPHNTTAAVAVANIFRAREHEALVLLLLSTTQGPGNYPGTMPRNEPLHDHETTQLRADASEEEIDIPADEIFPPPPASRPRRIWSSFTAFLKANTGLLLVASSQAFLSLMNVSVKQLNSIDPPVSAIQVCRSNAYLVYLVTEQSKLVDVRMVCTVSLILQPPLL
jgi:hypothetical protein